MIRVILPSHLRMLASTDAEVKLTLDEPVTLNSVLEALEEVYPALRGTIREYGTGARRPLLRFYACQEDLTFQPLDAPLPDTVLSGAEPLRIIGAIAGG